MANNPNQKGAYISLDELIGLQHQASGFSFLPRQPIHSLLSGRHASRLRGRGLDFEELRPYLPGDDIRTMDWKVTRRTRQPYVRVYTEERERPVLAVVDQRMSMFFGTRVNMKSVTAAETAALAAWRVVSAGDRIGAVVFNDKDIIEIRPRRSRKTVMQILQAIVKQNHELGVDRNINSDPGMLDRVLQRVAHLAKHDYLICVISDFSGITDDTARLVKFISRHNDVMVALIYDPIAGKIPDAGTFVVSDGENQIALDTGDAGLRKRYPELLQGRLDTLTRELSKYGVPVLPIHTEKGVAEQVRKILGYAPGKQAKAKTSAVKGSR